MLDLSASYGIIAAEHSSDGRHATFPAPADVTWPAKEARMAAMKPRTGEGPLDVTKEGRGLVMRVPLEGGGRLVVELSPDEAAALSEALKGATS
jgi:hypothetical protein